MTFGANEGGSGVVDNETLRITANELEKSLNGKAHMMATGKRPELPLS
jgi:hypothetical protein